MLSPSAVQWQLFSSNDQASVTLLLLSDVAVSEGLLAAEGVNISKYINVNNQTRT